MPRLTDTQNSTRIDKEIGKSQRKNSIVVQQKSHDKISNIQ